MFIVYSLNTRKAVFSYSIGNSLNLIDMANHLRKERWKSELVINAFGAELDFFIANNIIKYSGERMIQRKMMIGDIIKMVSTLSAASNSYLVA